MLFKTGSSSSRIGEQDRMDNVRKAAAIKADVFAIFAEQDEMMPPTIAHRLLVARYGASADSDMIHSRQLCVPGGHCAFFADTPEHAHKYTQVRTSPLNSGAARRAPRHAPSLLGRSFPPPTCATRPAPSRPAPSRAVVFSRVLAFSRVLTRSGRRFSLHAPLHVAVPVLMWLPQTMTWQYPIASGSARRA
jgi:hypothetical protein